MTIGYRRTVGARPTAPSIHPGAALRRAVALLAAGTGAGAVTIALVGHALGLRAGRGVPRVDALVEAGVSAIGAAVTAWLALSALFAALCLLARATGATWRAGERVVQRCAPAIVRRAVGVAVAAGLGAAVATGAQAATPVAVPEPEVSAAAADLGWVVTAPQDRTPSAATASGTPTQSPTPPDATPRAARSAAPPGAAPSAAATPAAIASTAGAGTPAAGPSDPARPGPLVAVTDVAPATLVVQPGDSLWRLAARRLGEAPSDAAVAAAWPEWYAANRTTIGDDPDLILPGQVLVVPDEVAR